MKISRTCRMLAVATLTILVSSSIFAQAPPPPPASFAPDQLNQLVARIALYPDPLLAQILAGATYPDQIPDAAKWADRAPLPHRTSPRRRDPGGSIAMGSQRSGAAAVPVRVGHDGVRHELDHPNWKCVSRAAAGCHGRGPKAARERPAIRIPANERSSCRERRALHHDHARQSSFHRRSVL